MSPQEGPWVGRLPKEIAGKGTARKSRAGGLPPDGCLPAPFSPQPSARPSLQFQVGSANSALGLVWSREEAIAGGRPQSLVLTLSLTLGNSASFRSLPPLPHLLNGNNNPRPLHPPLMDFMRTSDQWERIHENPLFPDREF